MRLIALCLLLTACSTQPYVSVKTGARQVNGDLGFVACLEIGQEFGRNSVAVEHCSNPGRGSPFNDRFDYSVDTLSYQRKFWGNAR